MAAIDDLQSAVSVLQGIVPDAVTKINEGVAAEGVIAAATAAINTASQALNDAVHPATVDPGVPTSS